MLDPEARKELRTLSRETSDLVARHLVVTGQMLDEDPEQALAHARAARALAGRVGVVREAAGLAAYAAGSWAEALSELRAARRITGEPAHLAVAADCERALGRPERALTYADDPDVAALPQEERVELIIVLAGARRDLGQQDAAVLLLQEPARRTTDKRPWAARLWYAYADALLAAGRESEAEQWFERATAVDLDGRTDAGDRLLALQGVVLDDPDGQMEEDEERDDLPSADELAQLVRDIPTSGSSSEGIRDLAALDSSQPTGTGRPPSAATQVASVVAAPVTDPAPSTADQRHGPRPMPSGPFSSGESSPVSDRTEPRPMSSGPFLSGESEVLTPAERAPTPAESDSKEQGRAATARVPPVPAAAPARERSTDEAEDEPAPVVTPRGSVAAPTFVAPPAGDDQDLRLFD
jgi:hypothetical protein